MAESALNTVYSYHDRTKHHFRRYARSLGFMDWATQPDPFRRFTGCPVERLEVPAAFGPSWDALFGGAGGATVPAPVDRSSISRFFFLSLALSAWKEVAGPDGDVASRWSLRVNPSSGNLHPTEGYLANADGLFHYRPDVHGLERRADLPEWSKWAENLPEGAFLVGLTSIHWREAWKYGERAFRYCQHDCGHAVAALSLAARCLGWSARLLPGPATAEIEALLGVSSQSGPEKEHGDAVLLVSPGEIDPETIPEGLPPAENITGRPETLSDDHQDWPVIAEVAEATTWPGEKSNVLDDGETLPTADRDRSAFDIIRGRRSAVAMDGETALTASVFFAMLARLIPASGHPVFDAWPWAPEVSLALFVHRIEGLEPGLYTLVRAPSHREELQAATQPKFAWEKPAECPASLPLYLLGTGDVRRAAAQLSCGQTIAADGAFSLGMLARFDGALTAHGPGFYPRLFWETGLIGQMLYLESEAAGFRGTGIGCFFDDEVHGALGLEGHIWQSLYHFTVGGAVDDVRLQTRPAYDNAK